MSLSWSQIFRLGIGANGPGVHCCADHLHAQPPHGG